jgi:serine/threonine protein kinase
VLVAAVAEALHYAHRKGLVHRDIKPGNIVVDSTGKPYVADFGLALKEENIGKGSQFLGTVLYMSPEQARGEGHRVDGRSCPSGKRAPGRFSLQAVTRPGRSR